MTNDLTTIEVFSEDGFLFAQADGRKDFSFAIEWPNQITSSTDSLDVAAAVTSHLGLTQDRIESVDHDKDMIFIHIR